MASTRSSPQLSSITSHSESGSSVTNSNINSVSENTPSTTSSASDSWHMTVAYAAVPATILESELSHTLDHSKMSNDIIAAQILSESSDHNSSSEDQSPDEEATFKSIIKAKKAAQIAAALKAQELELKRRLKLKQRSNTSQSSRGSNDRSRTRLYGNAAEVEQYDVFTPLQVSFDAMEYSAPVRVTTHHPLTSRSAVVWALSTMSTSR